MYRVVIADDEPMICKGLRETIEWDSLGLEISGEARNGVDALALVQAQRPHILITDIRMPGMNGIELITAIRKLDLQIKIIIISGFSDYAFLKEAIRLGVDGYLLKPIDNDELISNLADLVNTIEKEMLRSNQLYQGIELLRANTLNRLVTNAIGLSEFEEKSTFLEIAFTAERYLCVVCMPENNNSDLPSENERIIAYAMQRMSSALAEDAGIPFIDVKGRVVVLLFGDSEEAMFATAKVVLEGVAKQVLQQYGKPLAASTGSVVCSIQEIWESYAVATEQLGCDKLDMEEEQPEEKWNHVVDRTLAYIDAHYHEALSLKQIANACCINTSYLGQIFKKTTGESFTNYVNSYRIQKAKELLAQSSLKVYEIAEKVGFTDYHYFLKIFKKVAGVLPKETRCCNYYHKN